MVCLLWNPTAPRYVSRLVVGGLIAFCILGLAVPPPPGVAQPIAHNNLRDRPNLVFLLVDDATCEQIKAMPFTRRYFERNGIVFENAYVSTALCCPSRAVLLTGKFAHNTGLYFGRDPDNPDRGRGGVVGFNALGYDMANLAVWLQQAGYRTGLVGKYLNGYEDLSLGVPPGWDEWNALADTAFSYYDYDMSINGRRVHYGYHEQDYSTDVTRDHAVRFLSANDDRPFFLWTSFVAPHSPAQEAPRHAGTLSELNIDLGPAFNETDVSDKPTWVRNLPLMDDFTQTLYLARYRKALACLLAVDEAVEAMINCLRNREQLENTLIIFMSDNGFSFGTHRHVTKTSPFNEDSNVPFMASFPRIVSSPRIDKDNFVMNVDVATTFLAAAGVRADTDGIDLLPVLREPGRVLRDAALLEARSLDATDDHCRDQPDCSRPSYSGIVTRSHKYVEYVNGERELYDRQRDPFELLNVYDLTDPTLVSQLAQRLRALKDL